MGAQVVTCSAAPPTTVLAVTSVVPHNAVADTVLPTLSAAHVDIHEGGTPIWSDGKYLPGAAGITGATAELWRIGPSCPRLWHILIRSLALVEKATTGKVQLTRY